MGLRALVVVEGVSDQIAVEALAARREIDLTGVRVVPLGGAHRIGRFLEERGPPGDGVRLVGLCDEREAPIFRAALEHVHVCVADLEDELIRALGVAAVEDIVRANGDLHRFRKLQQMPAWRDRDTDEQLRRFIAAGARRKLRYARLLVDALDLESVPEPLDRVLDHVTG
jgi:Overcoming lysogenization defect protein-like, TOPRIM domain